MRSDSDRRPGAPGIDPCPQLDERGGIWRFKADVVGQKYTKEARFASGMRQPVAVAWHDGHLYAAMNSRDSLDTLFPEKGYTAEDNAVGPSEPMLQIDQNDVFGWPYCYHDSRVQAMILAPEYGGDGKTLPLLEVRGAVRDVPCALRAGRLDVLHAHALPAKYRGGAFMTSQRVLESRAVSMAVTNIGFQPVRERTRGPNEVFADASKAWNRLKIQPTQTARPNAVRRTGWHLVHYRECEGEDLASGCIGEVKNKK